MKLGRGRSRWKTRTFRLKGSISACSGDHFPFILMMHNRRVNLPIEWH
jgi:hypothetical protein